MCMADKPPYRHSSSVWASTLSFTHDSCYLPLWVLLTTSTKMQKNPDLCIQVLVVKMLRWFWYKEICLMCKLYMSGTQCTYGSLRHRDWRPLCSLLEIEKHWRRSMLRNRSRCQCQNRCVCEQSVTRDALFRGSVHRVVPESCPFILSQME